MRNNKVKLCVTNAFAATVNYAQSFVRVKARLSFSVIYFFSNLLASD